MVFDFDDLDFIDMGPVVCMPDPCDPYRTIEFQNPYYMTAEEIGSFADYCRGHFGQGWMQTLSWQIQDGDVPVGKISVTVPAPERFDVTSIYIVRMEFTRINRHRFSADAIVTAEIKAEMTAPDGSALEDTLTQWYRLRHIFTIHNSGYGLETVDTLIYDKADRAEGIPLDDYLIPVLSSELMETEAGNLLDEYLPEALSPHTGVNATLLATRMGLRICTEDLSAKELLGEVRFDRDGNGGVIIVDSGLDSGKCEKVIIHECCHYYEHNLFVWAQALYNDDICQITCPSAPDSVLYETRTPIHWAELQARTMTYRVQMNRPSMLYAVEELNRFYCDHHHIVNDGYRLEWVIRRLAFQFHTTLQSARNRMAELGFPEARGVFNYINGKKIPPFFHSGVLDKNHTFLIGLREAAAELSRNEKFHDLLKSGRYIYIEGKFCIYDRKYIRRGGKGLEMTSYARKHTEECCLRFEVRYQNHKPSYVWGEFHWEGPGTVTVRDHVFVVPHNAAEPGLCDIAEVTAQTKWCAAVKADIVGMPFNETLSYLMQARNTTIEQLEEKSMISARTISRLRSDPNHEVKKKQVVAIAIGLRLPPQISMILMEKAGSHLTDYGADIYYRSILYFMYGHSIHTVNDYLESMELEPLTKLATTAAAY